MAVEASELAIAAGKVLRKLRKEAELSQEELGFQAGIQRNFVSELELGRKQPSLGTVFKLSGALGVEPHEFVWMVQDALAARS